MTREEYRNKRDEIIQVEARCAYDREVDLNVLAETYIAELEYKLANYEAAVDGHTHWCPECKMRDDKIAELEADKVRVKEGIESALWIWKDTPFYYKAMKVFEEEK